MPGVVHEAVVIGMFDRASLTELRQPARDRRAPATRVDDEVGKHLIAAGGDDADHVRNAVQCRGPGQQPAHGHAAADLQAGLLAGQPSDRALDDGAAARDESEALIARAQATGHRFRQRRNPVAVERTVGDERRHDLWQLGIEQLPEPGKEAVELAELGDAAALPARPAVIGPGGWGRRVPIEDADAVAVASEQHPAAQPGDPPTDDDDVGHGASSQGWSVSLRPGHRRRTGRSHPARGLPCRPCRCRRGSRPAAGRPARHRRWSPRAAARRRRSRRHCRPR